MRTPVTLFMLLTLLAGTGHAADPPQAGPSATMLAETMVQAGYSEGFEARLRLTTVNAYGHRTLPIKLAIIGQANPDRQRLLIRGISPDNIHDRFIAIERLEDGRFRAMEYGAKGADGNPKVDLFAKLFDTGIVIWDMFSPWWHWPIQKLEGVKQLAGRGCALVRSQYGPGKAPIQEAVSCVDKEAGLSLETQLFDGQKKLLRTISVMQMITKENKTMAAKQVLITEADATVTEAELYSGDENYVITPDTFPAFYSLPIAQK